MPAQLLPRWASLTPCLLATRQRLCSGRPAAGLDRGRQQRQQGRRCGCSVHALLKEKPGQDTAWTQDVDEVSLLFPVPADAHKADVRFEVHPTRLAFSLRGETLLEGDFDGHRVLIDGCYWAFEERDGKKYVVLTLEKAESGYQSWRELLERERPDTTITHRVFLRLSVGGVDRGALAIGLFGRVAPKTVENFRSLCTGEKGVGTKGVPLHYKGSRFHRLIPRFMIQGGDFTNGDGTGGESIYGERFPDETFALRHDAAGLVSMANSGADSNGSQFFITFDAQPHLDLRHVVFGKVLHGMKLLREVEDEGNPNDSEAPFQEVAIADCGEVAEADWQRWLSDARSEAAELEMRARRAKQEAQQAAQAGQAQQQQGAAAS